MPFVYVEHWYTIAVTPLPPGWFNVYGNDDGTEFAERCPVVLLQEHRETCHAGETKNVTRKELPYDTRVVWGDSTPDPDGMIEPASDAENYLRTEYRGEG